MKDVENFFMENFVYILQRIRMHVIFYRRVYVRYRTDGRVGFGYSGVFTVLMHSKKLTLLRLCI